jgi:ferric-dicitrate binding protein FerR (iron transport regulator)
LNHQCRGNRHKIAARQNRAAEHELVQPRVRTGMFHVSIRRIARLACPLGVILAVVAGCSSDGADVPAPTTNPSNVGSVNVGDGSGVELEPGSNLPPTDSERSGDGSAPAGSLVGSNSTSLPD